MQREPAEMRIRVRLFASLRDRFPPEDRGRGEIELGDGSSLGDLLDRLAIADPGVQMVLIDGQQTTRKHSERVAQELQDGQTVSIFPPVGGG